MINLSDTSQLDSPIPPLDNYADTITYRGRTIAVRKVFEVKRNGRRPAADHGILFAAADGNYYRRKIRGFQVNRIAVTQEVEHYANQARIRGRAFDRKQIRENARNWHRTPLYSVTKMTRRWAMNWAIVSAFDHKATCDFLTGLVAHASRGLPRQGW